MTVVHIVLKEEVSDRTIARQEVFAVSNIQNVNEKLFDKYGIISGKVEPKVIDNIRKLDCVSSVSEDAPRHAIDD